MKIRTSEEMRLFEQALDQCKKAVLLLTPDGRQFDLKNPMGRHQGIAQLLSVNKNRLEPEIYTNCFEDEMVMFDFIAQSRRIA